MLRRLQRRLEESARYFERGKSWIIPRALAAEARQQSVLAGSIATEDEEFWQHQADTTGWR
jgi:predicted transcriptional regulator